MLASRPHPFPTVRSGGLFLILIGLTVMLSALFSGSRPMRPVIFIAGTAIAILVGLILLRHRLEFGEQTAAQRKAVFAALFTEGIGVWLVVELVGTDDLRTLWLWLFLVVGLHFLVFSLVHGPKMLVLGVLVAANAAIGLLLPSLPFLALALIDAVLKVGIGVLLFTNQTTVVDQWFRGVEARLGVTARTATASRVAQR